MGVTRVDDGPVAVLTLDRPEALNAITDEIFDDLEAHLTEIDADETIRAIVITGAGDKAFCAGADIGRMRDASVDNARAWAHRGHRAFRRIHDARPPVIAAINGWALGGGCELVLACDLRIADPRARIGLPEVTLGVLPGWGGTVRLPRLVGPAHAAGMILDGKPVDADEALRIGLVNRLSAPGAVRDDAVRWASQIADNAPQAVAAAKNAIARSVDIAQDDLIAQEIEDFAALFATEDQREGMRAFFEKRPARFVGR